MFMLCATAATGQKIQVMWQMFTYSLGLCSRNFPLDMAGFAIHLCQFFKHPKARVGVNVRGESSRLGFLETDLLEHFTKKYAVECRGSEKEVNISNSCLSLCKY